MAAEVTDVQIEEDGIDESQPEGPIGEAIEDEVNADGLAELNAKLDEIAVNLVPTELNPPYALIFTVSPLFTPIIRFSSSRPEQEYPLSYQRNTPKETETLAYARNFERQFSTLYPQRRPLNMVIKNECGVEVLLLLGNDICPLTNHLG
jgi:hypothetical protein